MLLSLKCRMYGERVHTPCSGTTDDGTERQCECRCHLFPCCQHCSDGDGMLPCGQFHGEPCGTGDCGLITDAELAWWRKGLQL